VSRLSIFKIGLKAAALALIITSSSGCSPTVPPTGALPGVGPIELSPTAPAGLSTSPAAGALPGVVPIELSPTAPAGLSTSPAVCTEIGCSNNLNLQLKGNVPKEYDIEVTAPDGATFQAHCVDGQASVEQSGEQLITCTESRSIAFENFAPEEVLVTLTWEGGNLIQSFKPAYNTFRPNGPSCEPECKTGLVELYIP